MGTIINHVSKTKKLGEVLIDAGLLNPTNLEKALTEAKKRNIRLGNALISLGIISEDKMLDALSSQLSLRKIDLSKTIVDPAIGKLVPERLAKQFKMVPVTMVGDVLTVALSDPLNVFALDALKRDVNANIEIALSNERDILKAIDYVWTAKEVSKAAAGQSVVSADAFNFGADKSTSFASVASANTQKDDSVNDVNIIKLVNLIIFSGAKNRASDIHIEPLEDIIIVRERIDGELVKVKEIPLQLLNPVIARIKIMANMDIAEKRNPQDSRFDINIGEKNLDIRVSVVPTINGEKVVFRLLDKSSKVAKISESSLDKNDRDKILKIIYKKYGLFLISGPTGSGKTTTAYSVISELNNIHKNIITVEDPVEYKMRYVNQIEVNQKGGVGFADALRAVLRQDPDIILVGEIRDEETARIAIQAALTGHFVVSTIHTQDASSAVSRLIDMGIEPFLVSSSIAGIIGQRLIKKLCDSCKKPYTPEPELLKELGINPAGNYTFYKETGCDLCRDTGFHRRLSIREILVPTRNIQKLIIEKADSAQIRSQAIKEGFIPLRIAGLKKLMEGVTTLEEVLQATQDI
ncbi:MAG: Flp pilus assembly complex ATPase component TadA [Deltaproteobacteria bacterium]|nr:Flp pilus assembly complex ATPase component TadA [Deltaproteobacteria bacterium]MCL6119923.1 Flp pilus assembly complex ATPase component TadA [Deltaproteobacteria bacterium]